MVEIDCDGDCGKISKWKVIMNKAYRKNYKQKKMYFCSECIIDLLDGTWSGGGPNAYNIKKIIKIKKTRRSKKISENTENYLEKLEKQFPDWKVECCALVYPDPEELKFCLECGKSLKKEK